MFSEVRLRLIKVAIIDEKSCRFSAFLEAPALAHRYMVS